MNKTLGKDYIIKELQKRGLSRRMALSLFNKLIDYIKASLSKGEEVEVPFGKLIVVKRKQKPNRKFALGKIVTTYKKPYTVKLKTNE